MPHLLEVSGASQGWENISDLNAALAKGVSFLLPVPSSLSLCGKEDHGMLLRLLQG